MVRGALRTGLAVLLGCASAQVVQARAQSAPAQEYQLKAAFLFHFVQFVEWPPSSAGSLCVGILGEDPFGAALEDVVGGEVVQGRKLVIRRSDRVDQLKGCEVVFIGRSEKTRTAKLLAALDDGPTLTVGEIDGFAQLGGVINFFLDGKRVRFEINTAAARKQGLKVSSQLLTLGKIVRGEPSGRN